MLQKSIKFLFFALLITLISSQVFAAPPVAVFKDWTVFTVKQDEKHLCYIASLPFKKQGNYRKRGGPFVTVTRVKGNSFDEINVASGYIYKPAKDVEIAIDKNKFVLFSYEERAWASNRQVDIDIINKMKSGFKMEVTGYSMLGTYSVDTYSLLGFTDAYNKMVTLCK
jgi:hypothetical protein